MTSTGRISKESVTVDERIKEHLKLLNRYYLLLVGAKDADRENYLKDAILQGSTERFLHLAIESCLNVGNRLLSLAQFEKPVRTPETYADIFREMESLGVIDRPFAERLVKMAKFRNRLVHLYWELDNEIIYDFMQTHLGDFKLFEKKVVHYLSMQKS